VAGVSGWFRRYREEPPDEPADYEPTEAELMFAHIDVLSELRREVRQGRRDPDAYPTIRQIERQARERLLRERELDEARRRRRF
jgi:hypothetical protein